MHMMNSWKKLKRSGAYYRNIKKSRENFMTRAYEIRDELNKNSDIVRPIPTTAVINSEHHQQIFIQNEYHFSRQPPTCNTNINNYLHNDDSEGVFVFVLY